MGILLGERRGYDLGTRRGGGGLGAKLLIALAVAGFSLFTYFSNSEYNPITEKKQHLDMSPRQEIALGLQSAPQMAGKFGGLSDDLNAREQVKSIGSEIVSKSSASKTPYQYDFNLLADQKTVNAFALPGGPIFITEGLYRKLKTRGELAGVLGHEIGHVAARHSAQHIAKQKLTQGLTGAAVIAAYDPENPYNRGTAAMAALIGSVVNMKFGRGDELESDRLGVRFLSEAGYDPRGMIKVMEVLREASKSRTPEFFSTHPNPENRIEQINKAIRERYPNGVPKGMIP
ncbi:MAG: M48 family metalloprotease [Candidatus Obscuribacterales bacterium]|nr:M48 family metalloprotease [Candidatus Obscuribacterales bacterium]